MMLSVLPREPGLAGSIARRIKAEESLAKANASLTPFIYIASHNQMDSVHISEAIEWALYDVEARISATGAHITIESIPSVFRNMNYVSHLFLICFAIH